jgi:hypothetical protein
LGYLFAFVPTILWIACVVHAVMTGRYFPWLFVITFVPLIGPLIYLAVEVVPELMGTRTTRRLASGLATAANPNRGFRQAQRAAEMVGSVAAKRALAEQHLARGNFSEAIALYENMLEGQFRDDPALLLGLAKARFLADDGAGTQASLDALQKADPAFVSEDAHLLYARALELQGKNAEALDEYKKLVPYFAGEEARCRYAMLLQKTGAVDQARALFAEILKSLDGAPSHYRRAQKEWAGIARAGLR